VAGHSRWANIKRKKERSDQAKGKLFSRCAKEIISAVRVGGPDPRGNTRLRLAILNAKAVNMPSDNIERNIKKASSADQADYTQVTYEIYGHGGVGLLVDALTDNKNRTASDIRIAVNKRGGTIASPGAVSFNFDRKGVIQVPKEAVREEQLFDLAAEAGADELDEAEDRFLVLTPFDQCDAVRTFLEDKGIPIAESGLEMIPKALISCDEENRLANRALIEWLEGIDDVDVVYHNMEDEL
jgi:YebC/PmpR family DNA-binding regulatory protein